MLLWHKNTNREKNIRKTRNRRRSIRNIKMMRIGSQLRTWRKPDAQADPQKTKTIMKKRRANIIRSTKNTRNTRARRRRRLETQLRLKTRKTKLLGSQHRRFSTCYLLV